jgi:ribosome-associated heat shock protein Hsp15
MPDIETQRLDKWLWHARLSKTRPAAVQLIESGHVRVNQHKVKAASKLLRIGDILTIALAHDVMILRIVAFAQRRGPYSQASALYMRLNIEHAGQAHEE